MDSLKHRPNGYEIALWLVLILFFFCSLEPISMLSDLGISRFFTLGRYVSYLCLALLSFFNLADRKFHPVLAFRNFFGFIGNHLLLVLVAFCFLFCSIMASVVEPLVIILVLAACYKTNYRQDFLVILLTQLIFFIMIIALCKLGVLENLTFDRDGEMRASLGFIYPLELQSLLFFIALEFFYVFRKRVNWIAILLILAVNFFFYYQTRARFSTALLTVACVIIFFIRYGARIGLHIPEKIRIAPTTLAKGLITFWISGLTVFYYTISQHFLFSFRFRPLYNFLDKVFNNRIILARGAYFDYGWKAFGQTIDWIGLGGVKGEYWVDKVGKKYNYVDVSYFKNLFDYGYVFMFFTLVFYGSLWYQSFKKKDFVLSAIVFVILVGALFEPRLVQISMNPFLILGAGYLMSDNLFFYRLWNKVHFYGPAAKA